MSLEALRLTLDEEYINIPNFGLIPARIKSTLEKNNLPETRKIQVIKSSLKTTWEKFSIDSEDNSQAMVQKRARLKQYLIDYASNDQLGKYLFGPEFISADNNSEKQKKLKEELQERFDNYFNHEDCSILYDEAEKEAAFEVFQKVVKLVELKAMFIEENLEQLDPLHTAYKLMAIFDIRAGTAEERSKGIFRGFDNFCKNHWGLEKKPIHAMSIQEIPQYIVDNNKLFDLYQVAI